MLVREFPEITRIFTRIGTSEIATDPMPPNESDVYIFYKPVSEWPKSPGRPANKAELREQIEAALKKINPDYNILFAQPIEMRFNEMLEGTKAELAVKIFGQDYDVLEKLAEQVKEILEKTPGVAQVEYEIGPHAAVADQDPARRAPTPRPPSRRSEPRRQRGVGGPGGGQHGRGQPPS